MDRKVILDSGFAALGVFSILLWVNTLDDTKIIENVKNLKSVLDKVN
jgi:hypothetical protein